MITIEDFHLARRILSVFQYEQEFGHAGMWDHLTRDQQSMARLLVYPGGFWIQDMHVRSFAEQKAEIEGATLPPFGMPRYHLHLETTEHDSDNLAELERELYEYARGDLEDERREDLPHVKAAKAAHAIANALLVLADCYDESYHVEAVTCEAGSAGIIPRSIDEWAHDWFAMSHKLEGGKA